VAIEVEIDRLGAQGDGVAETPDGPLFVPFALPGERVRIEVDADGKTATLVDVLARSPDRVDPVCPHFGICGGCATQHLDGRTQVAAKQRGLDEVHGIYFGDGATSSNGFHSGLNFAGVLPRWTVRARWSEVLW